MRRLYSSPITHGRPIIYYLPRVKIAEETTRGAHSNNAPCYIRIYMWCTRRKAIAGHHRGLMASSSCTGTEDVHHDGAANTVSESEKNAKAKQTLLNNVNNYTSWCASSINVISRIKLLIMILSSQFWDIRFHFVAQTFWMDTNITIQCFSRVDDNDGNEWNKFWTSEWSF